MLFFILPGNEIQLTDNPQWVYVKYVQYKNDKLVIPSVQSMPLRLLILLVMQLGKNIVPLNLDQQHVLQEMYHVQEFVQNVLQLSEIILDHINHV